MQEQQEVAPEVQPQTEGVQSVEVTEKPQAAPTQEPVYTPNYKFKANDKEHEFDEWVRPAIKTPDAEKRIRELYEKAYGLDHIKPLAEKTQQRLQALEPKFNDLSGLAQELVESRDRGDYDALFQKIGLDETKLVKHFIDKANREALPEDVKSVYNKAQELERQDRTKTKAIEEYERRFNEMAGRARLAEVNSILARTEVNQVAKAFDAANGEGSFLNEVRNIGRMHHYDTNGEDLPAEQAVAIALKKYGMYASAQTGQPSPAAQAPAQKLPVIPNISGKGVSPVSKSPKNLKDLRKIASEWPE